MPKINVFFILGWDPPTRTSRQNVAAAICQVDSQIVAWPAVKGHRHRSQQVRHIADIILNLKMRYSDIVNLTNGGKNGITIRLHYNLYRRLEQTGPRSCSKFLLDYEFHRSKRNHGKKQNRDYVQDPIFTEIGNGSLDSYAAFKRGEENGEPTDWLQNQCWRALYQKIYEQMVKCQKRTDHGSSTEGGYRCQIDLCSSFERTFKKLLLSTIGRIVLLRQLKKFICLFAAGIAGQLARWKKLNWEGHSSISQNFTVNTLRNADQILENKFPLTTWARNRLGFFIYIKYKRNKEQAQVL